MLRILLNFMIAALSFAAIAAHCKNAGVPVVMRFFTAQSNLFCGAVCLLTGILLLSGAVPYWVLVLKYAATVAVTVTFLTVFLYLAPFGPGFKILLSGPDFYLHLFCPVLAVLTYILWDHADMPFYMVLVGTLPVLLYGSLYLYKVVSGKAKKPWDDFYVFNKEGRWPVSCAAMYLGTLVLSILLWLV